MKLKNILLSAFLFCFCGCSSVPYVVVFNNTQSTVVIKCVLTKDKLIRAYKLKSKEKLKIIYPIIDQAITVVKGEKELIYSFCYPPREAFIENNIIYLQMEADNKIYVVKRGNFPVKLLPVQPKGFPLSPK